jgi:single-stranded-DNA-specific exonuclease
MSNAVWNILPREHNDLVDQLLANRGVQPKDRDVFLLPDWEKDTYSPFIFTKMNEAVAAMFAALEKGDPIVIHGDYDADGVSGSSLLYGALVDIAERMKYVLNLEVFLPDREHDGYGVAMHTIERFIAEGKKLLVTIDCGIANGLELDRAFEAGLTTIVCDHHQMGTHFPEHAIVLHPLAPGEVYPNKTLCGTGVAFKFASALIEEARKRGADFPKGYEKWFLDLVAIATVTDVMPLTGENRVLEMYGLMVLNKTRRPGIRALLASSGTEIGSIDTQAIGFRIGPRLNAAGRLASARLAFETLTAKTIAEADGAALALEKLNRERQNIFRASYKEAEEMANVMINEGGHVLVVSSETWLPGIVGLIAGRLVSDFGKPAFALTKAGDKYVGSGRTAGGLHLVEAMNACGDIFLKKGGHPQACGLTIDALANVHLFRTRVNEFALGIFGSVGPQSSITIDAIVQPSAISLDMVNALDACAPFGEGNRPPIFATLGATVMSAEMMGSTGSHVRLTILDSNGVVCKLIGFGAGNMARELKMGDKIDVAYEAGVNVWNGKREVQCKIVEIRKSQA